MNIIQQILNTGRKSFPGELLLLAGIATTGHYALALDVSIAELNTDGDTSDLPVVVLPSGFLLSGVDLDANASSSQFTTELFGLAEQALHVISLGDAHDNDLGRSGSRGESQSFVISVNHDGDANLCSLILRMKKVTYGSSRKSPRVLPSQLLLLVFVLELDFEDLREVLSERVGRASLNGTTVSSDESLTSSRVGGSSELLLISLASPNGLASAERGQIT